MFNILAFKNEAAKHKKLNRSDGGEWDEAASVAIANKIKQEAMSRKHKNSSYETQLDNKNVKEECSPTLLRLLSCISNKFASSLAAKTIGYILTAVVTNQPTPLQLALAVLIRDRSDIDVLNKLGITCTYDELLRFKFSAAHAAANSIDKMGLNAASDGLVQVVADNFDANISSQNGLQSTHALAMLVTQNIKEMQ